MKIPQCILFLVFFLLIGIGGPSWAASMRCPRCYIQGLLIEHEKGLFVLGSDTVTDPEKMSVYITVCEYGHKRALYVQSNYKMPDDLFPIKIAANG